MSASTKTLRAETVMSLPTYPEIFERLTARYGLKRRASQTQLAEHVRDALTDQGVRCIEAPTGTGKTLGYLAGALDAMAHAGNPIPIVVATATVGLQEQILRYDIPRLAAVGALDPNKVAVAKGRGRYFCPRMAALLEDKKAQDSQMDMFAPEKDIAVSGLSEALAMLKAWRAREWNGDKDDWHGTMPKCWESACAAKSETCVNSACEHFQQCPYMLSRQKLSKATLIVANHDLVLADLAQRCDEQQTSALPPKRYALIVDEAHNLPEKALETRSAKVQLNELDWLLELADYGDATMACPRVARSLARIEGFSSAVFGAGAATLRVALENFAKVIAGRTYNLSGISNWALSQPEDALRTEAASLANSAFSLLAALQAASKAYTDFADEALGADKGFAIRQLTRTHLYQRRAADMQAGLASFCSSDRMVRWAARTPEGRITLHSRPLEGREVLDELLWKQEFPVVMVSATLKIAGSFKRFADKSGLPTHAVKAALPPVFDYSRGFFHQPGMAIEPGQEGYEAELAAKLVALRNKTPARGMLVLFTSKSTMRRVADALPTTLLAETLQQESRPLPELIAMHKARIDRGEHSILMGLNSLSEGLDLPGAYCEHVVITRLPFAVPGDPVEEARQQAMGKAWFEEAYLADMLIRLIQSAGRLIRREDDFGIITVLDKRLVTKRYGFKAYAALPDFSRGTRLHEFKSMVGSRGLTYEKPGPSPTKPAVHLATAADHPTGVQPPARGEKAVLSLVHSAPDAVPPAVQAPMAALARKSPLVPVSPALSEETPLLSALGEVLPAELGPFPGDEPDYVTMDRLDPCLPPGVPCELWAERQLPAAVLLGVRFLNLGFDAKMPAWQQALAVRPDLIHYLGVLRSHRNNTFDERRGVIPASQCTALLRRGLAGLDAPDEPQLIETLWRWETEGLALLRTPHRRPTAPFLQELVATGQKLVQGLRANRAPPAV